MVRLYGPAGMEMRGGTIAMNVYDPSGGLLDYRRVEELASAQQISLRTGCFCNPGAGEAAEGVTEEDVRAALEVSPDLTLTRFADVLHQRGSKSAGAIRVSLGIASNFDDVFRVLAFVEGFRDQSRRTVGEVAFDDSCRVLRDGS
jgi:molybdenum cofactor sulfurtransferase